MKVRLLKDWKIFKKGVVLDLTAGEIDILSRRGIVNKPKQEKRKQDGDKDQNAQ